MTPCVWLRESDSLCLVAGPHTIQYSFMVREQKRFESVARIRFNDELSLLLVVAEMIEDGLWCELGCGCGLK